MTTANIIMAIFLIVLGCFNVLLLCKMMKERHELSLQRDDLDIISSNLQKKSMALDLSEKQLKTNMFTQANCVTVAVSAKNKKKDGSVEREQDIQRSLAFQLGYKILKYCVIERELTEDGVTKYNTRINIYPEQK